MALIEYDLFGNVRDKVKCSVETVQYFCPPEGYYLAYSGGKDSVVAKKILDIAGVPYDTHYNMTTVDPPQLVRFIISQFEAVIYDYQDGTQKHFIIKDGRLQRGDITTNNVVHFSIPRLPMRKLIVEHKIPPTRKVRYCCEELKEVSGDGRVVVTGVRAAESRNRKQNQGKVVFPDGNVEAIAQENGAGFFVNRVGGVVLNYDDAASRRTVEQCYRTHKTLVNPIIDFTEEDVWDFIKAYNLPYCSLYDEGFKRLGCVGCPLGGYASQKRELERWPQFRKMYANAFDEMLQARIDDGKENPNIWTSGDDVVRWWVGDLTKSNPDQMSIDDLDLGE